MQVKIWDRKWNLIISFKNYTNQIWGLEEINSDTLATGDYDNMIKIWKISTGNLLKQIDSGSRVNCLQLLPSKLLVSGQYDGNILAWNVTSGLVTDNFKIENGHTDSVFDFALIDKENILASAGVDNVTILWNLTSQEKIKVLTGHTNTVNVLLFIPSNGMLATGSYDYTVKLWSQTNFTLIKTLKNGFGEIGLTLDMIGSDFLISGASNRIDIWQVSTGNLLNSVNTSVYFNALKTIDSSAIAVFLSFINNLIFKRLIIVFFNNYKGIQR